MLTLLSPYDILVRSQAFKEAGTRKIFLCYVNFDIANADNERLFNNMNMIKSRKRNKEDLPLLRTLLNI